MAVAKARFYPLGDSMLLLSFGDDMSPATNELVRGATALLDAFPITGSIEVVPAINSLAVAYDPGSISYERLTEEVSQLLREPLPILDPEPTVVDIPVCYGGDHGPDLAAVALHNELAVEEVIAIHSEPTYLTYMIGFAPGFPYLGGMAPSIATPRRASPRLKVPAGSVGIAGAQTGIYPLRSPGGWRLIGRTPLTLFHPDREPLTLLAPGDGVRFRAITPPEFDTLLEGGTP